MTTSDHRPLLILDLDETLIHGAESRLDRDADFRVGTFHVYKRPHLSDFLLTVAERFELAIWSSASDDYVSAIADVLSETQPHWKFVWGRTRCIQRMDMEWFETRFIKDLKKVKRLGYDLNRVLIVDDTPHKASRNYGNAIYVSPFEGKSDDQELPRLQRYLSSLAGEPDFRKIEKRGWRSR